MTSRIVLGCGSPLPLCRMDQLPCGFQSARELAHSETWRTVVAFLGLLALALSVHAQSYSIDWYKVSGGGGTSSNGQYSLSGSIGQHDAGGPMTGGNYSLTGGFWSLYAVQTAGAPLLTITYANNQAIVSWSPSVTGSTLQTNKNLATGTWGNYLGAVVNNRATNSPPAGNLFFRLEQ